MNRSISVNLDRAYRDVDHLEYRAGDVAAPVGVAHEGADEGEDVDGAGPFADAVGGLGVALMEHPPEEHHKVNADAEEGARYKCVVHCIVQGHRSRSNSRSSSFIHGGLKKIYRTRPDHFILPSSRMDDFHFPVLALTAGFPRLSIDPSSVIRDMVFESTVFGAITIFS